MFKSVILEFENENLENHERYTVSPVGFSWTTFMFAGKVLLYRKNILIYLIFSCCYFVSFVLLTLLIARIAFFIIVEQNGELYSSKMLIYSGILSFFIIRTFIACFCNKYFIKLLNKQGFKIIGVRTNGKRSTSPKDINYYNCKYYLNKK